MKILPFALGGVVAGTLASLVGIGAFERRRMGRVWRSLELEQSEGGFSESLVRDLPEPVQRYFRLFPGFPENVREDQGRPELPLDALHRHSNTRSPSGFVWKARARKGPILLEVVDHYARGAGRMRVVLFGLVPMVNATGPDLSKSALGRLMAESVLVPSSLLPQRGVVWEAEDSHHIKATITLGNEVTTLGLIINDEGGLQGVTLQRYGDQTETGEWAYIPFGMFGLGDLMSYAGPLLIRTFDWGNGQAAKDRQLAAGSPVLAVLGTGSDIPAQWLKAGQALDRVLLTAAANGISSSFLNQPIEIADLRPQLAAVIGRPGLPQLLLRMGYGPEVRPTPRRSVKEVLVEE